MRWKTWEVSDKWCYCVIPGFLSVSEMLDAVQLRETFPSPHLAWIWAHEELPEAIYGGCRAACMRIIA